MITIASAAVLLGAASAVFAGVAVTTNPSCPVTYLETRTETITVEAESTYSYMTTFVQEMTNFPLVTDTIPTDRVYTTTVTASDGSPTTEVTTDSWTLLYTYTNYYDNPPWSC
ncbi:hypothetical protein B0H21DRAFT_821641 [Amylocystis lapponica]|nr:hypothetical protein B0H21DRAFT_821641 [Amylocystis lapponica]